MTEDLAHFGSRGELLVPGVGLELNPQVRIGSGQVYGVLEALHSDRWLEQHLEALDFSGGKGEIEVEAYDRLGVRIDGLTADHAVTSSGLLKDMEHPLE